MAHKGSLTKHMVTNIYSEQYCTYLVEPNNLPVPMKSNDVTFGPFAWFSIEKTETDMYGKCCFELNFKSVLEAYQKCRKGIICYRVGGTLMYKREVTHVVIICCKEDKEYQSYPLILANSSKYVLYPTIGDYKW